jgi:hypothetical protein
LRSFELGGRDYDWWISGKNKCEIEDRALLSEMCFV